MLAKYLKLVDDAIDISTIDVSTGAMTMQAADTHFVTFLKKAPSASAAKAIEALSTDFDTLVVQGADVHWRMHGRSIESQIAKRHWEQILGPLSSTSRNVKALTKLSDKIAARASG